MGNAPKCLFFRKPFTIVPVASAVRKRRDQKSFEGIDNCRQTVQSGAQQEATKPDGASHYAGQQFDQSCKQDTQYGDVDENHFSFFILHPN